VIVMTGQLPFDLTIPAPFVEHFGQWESTTTPSGRLQAGNQQKQKLRRRRSQP
jgi:hypothetical protein